MNKIILCEGMTDAILLSYYLGKTAGWNHCKKPPSNIMIKEERFEESINWYQKDDDRLLICGVGGRDNMGSFFKNKILRTIVDADSFSRMAVVLDRDNKNTDSIETHASSVFRPVVTSMVNNQWVSNSYCDAFGKEQVLEALLVIIPMEQQGAMETLMLNSISENPYDAVIVERAGRFVKEIRRVASKYISSDRKELKTHLGVTWAVQYPEKVFRLMNEQIRSVEWEKSEVLHKCFEKLIEI